MKTKTKKRTKTKMKNLKFHPLCEAFPVMPQSELQDLADDIKANGQQEPIKVFEGQILDGRNRYLACELAGVAPKLETIKKIGDAVALVRSLNLYRRHLNESQRAMLGAELLAMNGADELETKVSESRLSTDDAEPPSREKVAELVNTSGPTLKRAIKVAKKGSKPLKRAVKAGRISVSKAAKVTKLPKAKQLAAAQAQPKKPARGGLASMAMAVKEETKAGSKHRDILDVLEDWWDENKANLNSHPAATPNRVYSLIRQVIVDNG